MVKEKKARMGGREERDSFIHFPFTTNPLAQNQNLPASAKKIKVNEKGNEGFEILIYFVRILPPVLKNAVPSSLQVFNPCCNLWDD